MAMGAATLTSSTTLSPSPLGEIASPPFFTPVVEQGGLVEPVEVHIGGVDWQCRPGAEGVIRALPAEAWGHPEDQGWKRVKHNARREVWRAVIQERPYYLKYYAPPPGFRAVWCRLRRPACQGEWESGLYADRMGIATVTPVAYTLDVTRAGRRRALLITAGEEPSRALSAFWSQLCSDDDVRRKRADVVQLTELLAQLIARAHQAGFEHLDMHAANLLVQSLRPRHYRVLLVDLQSARRGVSITDQAVVRNLAQLNQWFRRHSTIGERLRFLRAYLRWRNEYEALLPHGRSVGLSFRELVSALARMADRHAERLWAQRDRRLFKKGRYYTRLRLGGGWRGMAVASCKHALEESPASKLVFDRDWWQAQFKDGLEGLLDSAGVSRKDSHSASVSVAALVHDNGPVGVIVKRPRARNGWRRLVQMLPPSRSRRGWQVGHALLHRDVPTARPLALVERCFGPLVTDSLLVTELLPGAMDLESFLREKRQELDERGWVRLKRDLTRRLVRLMRQLHERGFDHRDCKASNILVLQRPQNELVWIDMDGLRRVGRVSRRQRVRTLARLQVSLREVVGLTRGDRVRFMKWYCAGFGQSPDAWRQWWPALVAASARKLRAKVARTAWKVRNYGRP